MKESQKIEDKNWELIAKSIYDKSSDIEKDKISPTLLELLSDTKELAEIKKITGEIDSYFELNKFPADLAWNKVEAQIHKKSASDQNKSVQILNQPFYRFAAAVILAAILLFSGYKVYYNPNGNANLVEVTSADQVLKTTLLSDGTLVSLNANSKIIFPKKFGKETREISIEGEAFFEVKPNKNKPFIIHAGNAQIKVLGTSFNVNAYPETKMVEVIVETGKVQVLNTAAETISNKELILDPGDKGTLVFSNNSMQKTTNLNPNFLAWKTHILIFKATSLSEVITTLEKIYQVKISLANPNLNELLLTAQFNDYSIDLILKVIETTFNVDYQNVNGQYIIKAKS